MSPPMNTRLDRPTATGDPVVRAVLAVTAVVTVIGVLALVRAATGDGVDHVTVRVDNQAGLAVQVDALDASGDRVGLGEAEPDAMTTFSQVPDVGAHWTLVAAYGGREVHRASLTRADLAAGNWTVTIPAGATSTLERAGFQ
jgi:catechol 2,3-dioxygenase-like lactoylglutathione lyase family enzyme